MLYGSSAGICFGLNGGEEAIDGSWKDKREDR